MAKFKIGDKVRVRAGYNANPGQAGREFTIRTDESTYQGEQSWGGENSPYRFKESDLEPVNGSPVRTVARKEIVGGEYGRVRVLPLRGVSDLKVGVRLTVDRDNADLVALEASELRAAATTFNELADALEEAEAQS